MNKETWKIIRMLVHLSILIIYSYKIITTPHEYDIQVRDAFWALFGLINLNNETNDKD